MGAGRRRRFLERLRSFGIDRPRLKVLPLWRLGAETSRTRGYGEREKLTADCVTPEGLGNLQCTSGRMISGRGVFVCPILIEEPGARMGETLRQSLRPFDLGYSACHTCYETGVTCRT